MTLSYSRIRSPWKEGSIKAPLAQVLVAVEQQHRARAQHRPERRVRLSGAQLLMRPAEDLLDDLGVEDHHELGVEQRRRGGPGSGETAVRTSREPPPFR